jgi:hypothetical protein
MGYIGAGISRFNTADELTVTGDATIDTTTLVVDSTNNRVGIGIAAPSEELEISGTGVQTLKVDRTDASTAGALTINSANGSNYIYNLTAKKLIFGTNNTSGLTIDENNKIGIGTTAPAHNVEIVATAAGSVNDSLQIRNNATSSGTGSRIRFINSTDANSDANGASIASVRNGNDNDLVFETENATRMTIDHAGNVGIGSASPAKPLTVVGGDFSTVLLDNSNAAHGTQILFQANGATNSGCDIQMSDAGGMKIRTLAVEPLSFHTSASAGSPSERMRLDSSGNLLVGKTADNVATVGIEARATGPLISTRDGSDALRLNRLNSDGEIIQLRKDGTTVGSIGVVNTNNPFISNDADNSGLQFASTSILPHYDSLQRDNAVDLGSTSVRFKDGYFSNGITARYHYNINDPDTYIDFATNNLINYYVGGAERGRFVTTGFVVGKTSSGDISVAGAEMSTQGYGMFSHNTNIALYANRGDTGTLVWFGRAGANKGDISVSSTAVAFNTSSDRRLKSNIQNAASASDKIDAIQVRQFDWKADDSHQDYGLIAQELQPIEPMAVSGDENSDEMMAVDYSKLVPMLIKEIQELRSRVAALEE